MKVTLPEIFLGLVFLISFVSARQLINSDGAINHDVLLTEDDAEIRNLTAALARKQRIMVETTIILPRTRTVDVNKLRQKKSLLSRINLKIKQNLKKLADKVRNRKKNNY